MIHVVQLMRAFAIQSPTKRMRLVNVTVKRMLADVDAINVWKDSGIWMQTIHSVAKNVHVIRSEQSEIWDVTFTQGNVFASA